MQESAQVKAIPAIIYIFCSVCSKIVAAPALIDMSDAVISPGKGNEVTGVTKTHVTVGERAALVSREKSARESCTDVRRSRRFSASL